jgi:hypothetical protein
MSTAKISAPISGDKLYQERARIALPLLVRQALAGIPIHYSDLANELGMPNARNLNFVLGSIGQSLEALSDVWKEKIPPINCLVTNKNTGLPGEGVGDFLTNENFSVLSLRQKRAIVDAALQQIFSYSRWGEVLKALALQPTQTNFSAHIPSAEKSKGIGGGESEHHKLLKNYVAQHPESIGLTVSASLGVTECPLPSGDSLDVSFKSKKIWIGVEVKSAISDESDIVRGFFQCVKYRAVMEAVQILEGGQQSSRVLLALEALLPQSLVALKNVLGIEVVDGVIPKND